ncbi:MAG: nucleoside phosphorylase [Flavobacteriales bacterium]
MQGKLRTSNLPIAHSELILRPDGSIYHLGIRPEHVASKIIIVGDPERVPMISRLFDQVEFQVASREFVVHTGTFQGKRITVVSSGIGVDNIDILINELDAVMNIDLQTRMVKPEITQLEIVRIGTSGALQADIPTGSFVASKFAFAVDGVPLSYSSQHNDKESIVFEQLKSQFNWLSEQNSLYVASCDDSLLDRIGFDFYQGITATANGFYGPQGRSLRLQSDMETRIDQYAGFSMDNYRITNFEMECAGIYALASMLGHKALTVCAILANRATKEFHNNPSASIESLISTVLQRF